MNDDPQPDDAEDTEIGDMGAQDLLMLSRADHALRDVLTVLSDSIGLDLDDDVYALTFRAAIAALRDLISSETGKDDAIVAARIERERSILRSLGPVTHEQ